MTVEPSVKPLIQIDASSPAIGMLEMGSIARGMVVADAMVKQAEVRLLRLDAVTPGKLLVLIAGFEEEVLQSLQRGNELGRDAVIDQLYLPGADPQLAPAIMGALGPREVEALAIVETYSVASAIRSADRAVKVGDVRLARMRLARGLGGKAFYLLEGELFQLESAVEAATEELMGSAMMIRTEIIARPHPDFVERIWAA